MLDGHNPHATAIGQEVASAALCNLAADENNRSEIAVAGAIPHLVHLVLHGAAPGGGEYSAHALGSLACHNPENAFSIIQVSKTRLPPATSLHWHLLTNRPYPIGTTGRSSAGTPTHDRPFHPLGGGGGYPCPP